MNYTPEVITASNADGQRVLEAWQELHLTRANMAQLDRSAERITSDRYSIIERSKLEIDAIDRPLNPELAQKLAKLSIREHFTDRERAELRTQNLDQASDLTHLLLSYAGAEVVAASIERYPHAIRTISSHVHRGFATVAWGHFIAGMVGYSSDTFSLRALGKNWLGDIRLSDSRSYEITPITTFGDPAIRLQIR